MLDWFSDFFTKITDGQTKVAIPDLELQDLLRISLKECEDFYHYAAEIGKWNTDVAKRPHFKSKILDLYRGLIVKVFVEIGSADRRWSREEVEMASIIFQNLWGSKTDLNSSRDIIERFVVESKKLTWRSLLLPFCTIPALHEEHVELEILIMRIANLIAKADGEICESELKRLEKIEKEVRKALEAEPPKKNEAQVKIPAGAGISKSDNQKKQAMKEPNQEIDKKKQLDNAMKELNTLVGLKEVKQEINNLVDFLKIQKAREKHGIPKTDISLHMVFCGNPGTGKTTVARIVGHILSGLDFLERGHTIETDRSGLVAGYAGQTGIKTGERIDEAMDGVLFVDEAYSLSSEVAEDLFGDEAIQVMLKRMEDDRERLVVILAGYSEPMKKMIHSNPGLSSRFQRTFIFPDYDAEGMFQIFKIMCKKHHYRYTKSAKEKLLKGFHQAWLKRDEHFGNGRYVRNVFEKTIRHMSSRLAKVSPLTKELLITIVDEDIQLEVTEPE